MDQIGGRKPFRHYVREWIVKKDINQERLAGRLGVESSTVSKLLTGRMRMSDVWLERIAYALNIEVVDLLRDPARPTQEELLAGLDDEKKKYVIQMIQVLKEEKTGTDG